MSGMRFWRGTELPHTPLRHVVGTGGGYGTSQADTTVGLGNMTSTWPNHFHTRDRKNDNNKVSTATQEWQQDQG